MTTVVRLKTAKHLSYDMGAAISAFLSCAESKNLSKETINFYRGRLLSFTRYLDEHAPCPSQKPHPAIHDVPGKPKDSDFSNWRSSQTG